MDNISSVERMDFNKILPMQHFVFDSTRHERTQRAAGVSRKIAGRSFSQLLDEQLQRQ